MHFTLPQTTIEQLELYSEILKKNPSKIIQEALDKYFSEVEQAMLEQGMESEKKLTTFSNDEFWDGLDIAD